MAYQKISDLKSKIQTLIDRAQNILKLGEGVRNYDHTRYVTFNVKVRLDSIEDILGDLPLPSLMCKKFQDEHKWLTENFLEKQRETVIEWFTVDNETALTDETEKRKKSAMWNLNSDDVGFYGRGCGHFAFFKADLMQQIINDCNFELKYSTKREELLDFIERGNYEGFNGRCDDVMWVYETLVKDMTKTLKSDWKTEVEYYVDQFELDLDESDTAEIINDITELISFPFNKIQLLTTAKEGVKFIVFLTENHKLLNRDSFIGLFKSERRNSVKWLDSFSGEDNPTVNFLDNRKKLLDNTLAGWVHEQWVR